MPVRLADPDRDAVAVAAIYAAAVDTTIATFEEIPPAAETAAMSSGLLQGYIAPPMIGSCTPT